MKQSKIKERFKVVDHSVSGEQFMLIYDEQHQMYHTQPRPDRDILPCYYESADYISHTDSKRSLLEYIYQIVRGITLSRKQKLLTRLHPQKGTVLDIGCGTGDFLKKLKEEGWGAIGVEPAAGARTIAQSKNIEVAGSIVNLSGQYNVITMWHVLEHVYDLQDQIDWLDNHLKDDGTLLIAVPNYRSKDAQHYGCNWAAYDVPRHLYHFSQESIVSLFSENFDVVKKIPMRFDAYYVSLLSEKYKTGHTNFLRAIWQGVRSNWSARHTSEYSSLVYVLKKRNTQFKANYSTFYEP